MEARLRYRHPLPGVLWRMGLDELRVQQGCVWTRAEMPVTKRASDSNCAFVVRWCPQGAFYSSYFSNRNVSETHQCCLHRIPHRFSTSATYDQEWQVEQPDDHAPFSCTADAWCWVSMFNFFITGFVAALRTLRDPRPPLFVQLALVGLVFYVCCLLNEHISNIMHKVPIAFKSIKAKLLIYADTCVCYILSLLPFLSYMISVFSFLLMFFYQNV